MTNLSREAYLNVPLGVAHAALSHEVVISHTANRVCDAYRTARYNAVVLL